MDDVQAIEHVYKETGNHLLWALLGYISDREVASDATAEAFARALGTADTIRDPAAWVWRVAFRVATGHLREARRTSMDPKVSYEIDQQALGVVVALRQLSRRQRAVFVLFYSTIDPRTRSRNCSGWLRRPYRCTCTAPVASSARS
jgi:DNA-directed RNA polymerase specialized sigma24 family protein